MTTMPSRSNLVRMIPAVAGALLVFFVYISNFLAARERDLRASDDNIWLYMTSAELRAPHRAQSVRDIMAIQVEQRAATPENARRFEMRTDYRENYFAFSLLLEGVSSISKTPMHQDLYAYADSIGRSFFRTTTIAAGFTIVLLITGLSVTRRDDYLLAAGLTLAAVALMSNLTQPGSFILFADPKLSAVLPNLLHFVLNPHDQFTVFGFTPRSYLFLLVMVVFAWRWRGWWAASYWLCAAFMPLHLSLAALFLGVLVAVDLALRREIFLKTSVAAPLIVAGIGWASRESLWGYLAPWIQAAAPFVMIGLVAVFAAIVFWIRREIANGKQPLILKSPTALKRLQAMPSSRSDLIVISGAWLLTLPVAYLISIQLDPVVSKYFWGQLHGRLYSLFYPSLIFALAVELIARLKTDQDRPRSILAAACGGLALGFAVNLTERRSPDFSEYYAELRNVAERSNVPITKPVSYYDEAPIYFAASRELDFGDGHLVKLVGAVPKP